MRVSQSAHYQILLEVVTTVQLLLLYNHCIFKYCPVLHLQQDSAVMQRSSADNPRNLQQYKAETSNETPRKVTRNWKHNI